MWRRYRGVRKRFKRIGTHEAKWMKATHRVREHGQVNWRNCVWVHPVEKRNTAVKTKVRLIDGSVCEKITHLSEFFII